MTPLLLRDATVAGARTDLLIRDGVVAAAGTGLDPAGAEVADLAGAVVLPGFTDAHAHLDKTLWGGPWVPHSAGPGLLAKIRNGRERRPELGIPNPDYITALLRNMIALGTTHVRSHVDVDPDLGLDAVTAVREAVARLDGRITAELVAFPQTGMLTSPGTEELMAAALREGVEHIGGIDPAGVDRDPVAHLDTVFGLAERYGAGVDVHLHDRGSLGLFQFELIIERAEALGMAGKVVISHGYALAEADPATRARLVEAMAAAGVGMATVAPALALPLKELHAAGVPVGLGNDGVRDLWSPYGTGDMLERAMFQAKNGGLVTDGDITLALDAAGPGGARLSGLPSHGVAVGDRADLVAVAVRTPAEALVLRPRRALVVKAGRIVARDGEVV